MTAATYLLSGGPFDGEIRTCESPALSVYTPRWPHPFSRQSSTTQIRVGHGSYRHDGRTFAWRDGQRIPVMAWQGFED